MNTLEPTETLAIPPGWLGDAVIALPALAALATLGPLTLLAHPRVAPIYRLVHPQARVAAFPSPAFALRAASAHRGVVAGRVGRAVVFPRSLSSAWRARLVGARERIGFDGGWRGRLLTHRVRLPWAARSRHISEEFALLAVAAGAGVEGSPPRIALPAEAREAGEQILRREGLSADEPLVAVCPGAAYGPAKRWPAERFAEIVTRLGHERVRVVLLGSEEDRAVAAVVERGAPGRPIDLVGRTDLRALAGVLGRSRVALVNDSGPMHLAAALGTPVVSVFGSTNPDWTRPLGEGHSVLRYPVPCAPCYRRRCPIERLCFAGVTVESVWRALTERLE